MRKKARNGKSPNLGNLRANVWKGQISGSTGSFEAGGVQPPIALERARMLNHLSGIDTGLPIKLEYIEADVNFVWANIQLSLCILWMTGKRKLIHPTERHVWAFSATSTPGDKDKGEEKRRRGNWFIQLKGKFGHSQPPQHLPLFLKRVWRGEGRGGGGLWRLQTKCQSGENKPGSAINTSSTSQPKRLQILNGSSWEGSAKFPNINRIVGDLFEGEGGELASLGKKSCKSLGGLFCSILFLSGSVKDGLKCKRCNQCHVKATRWQSLNGNATNPSFSCFLTKSMWESEQQSGLE